MEMNRNPYITKGINGLHMEIGEHGYVRTDPGGETVFVLLFQGCIW